MSHSSKENTGRSPRVPCAYGDGMSEKREPRLCSAGSADEHRGETQAHSEQDQDDAGHRARRQVPRRAPTPGEGSCYSADRRSDGEQQASYAADPDGEHRGDPAADGVSRGSDTGSHPRRGRRGGVRDDRRTDDRAFLDVLDGPFERRWRGMPERILTREHCGLRPFQGREDASRRIGRRSLHRFVWQEIEVPTIVR